MVVASGPSREWVGAALFALTAMVGLVVWRTSDDGKTLETVTSQDQTSTTSTAPLSDDTASDYGESLTGDIVIEDATGIEFNELPVAWEDADFPAETGAIVGLAVDAATVYALSEKALTFSSDLESWDSIDLAEATNTITGPATDFWFSAMSVSGDTIVLGGAMEGVDPGDADQPEPEPGQPNTCNFGETPIGIVAFSHDGGETWVSMAMSKADLPEGRFTHHRASPSVATDGEHLLATSGGSPELAVECILRQNGHHTVNGFGIGLQWFTTYDADGTEKRIPFADLDLTEAEREAAESITGTLAPGPIIRIGADGEIEELAQHADQLFARRGSIIARRSDGASPDRSSDGGDTWKRTPGIHWINLPQVGNLLLGQGTSGTGVSADGGATWNRLDLGPNLAPAGASTSGEYVLADSSYVGVSNGQLTGEVTVETAEQDHLRVGRVLSLRLPDGTWVHQPLQEVTGQPWSLGVTLVGDRIVAAVPGATGTSILVGQIEG
ncbi:MAG: exo-alpha-sialidase [Actinomycetia bacterium]|nr:exo-alpha-sialidase [Actinomycetes bacterium]